jgi:hypothetical protein
MRFKTLFQIWLGQLHVLSEATPQLKFFLLKLCHQLV